MSPGFEERAVPYEVARASLAGRLTETVRVGVPRYNRCIRLAVAFVSVVRADDADAESAADQSQPNHPLLSPAPAASMARSGMVVEIRVPTLSVVSSLAPGHRDVPSCDRTLRHAILDLRGGCPGGRYQNNKFKVTAGVVVILGVMPVGARASSKQAACLLQRESILAASE